THVICTPLTTALSPCSSFNAPPTTAIYPLSLHDALPIWLLHEVQQPLFLNKGEKIGREEKADPDIREKSGGISAPQRRPGRPQGRRRGQGRHAGGDKSPSEDPEENGTVL